MSATIIQDNTGGDPAGPDECGALYQRHNGTWDMDHPCVLEPGHLIEHEDDRGEVWA